MAINKIQELNFEYSPAGTGLNCRANDVSGVDTSIFQNENLGKKVSETEELNIVAHRGDSENAPENTIPAIISAAQNGYNTVECDISWTKDNVPVLLHDKTINRTARRKNGFPLLWPRKCSNMTYEELLKYDFGSWFDKDFKGTKIPALNELLEAASEYDLNLYLELKETDDFDEEKAEILANIIKDAGLEDKITWISFNSDYLKLISEKMPNSRLGYLSKNKIDDFTVDTLKDLDNGKNEVFLDIKSSKMTENGDKLIDNAGYDFEVWTVNNEKYLNDLGRLGCKGVTTNSLDEDTIEKYF